jgi:hypothetical protein
VIWNSELNFSNHPIATSCDNSNLDDLKATTLEQARQIMQQQINPMASVIPSISDPAANAANIAGINRLVSPGTYRHIVAWGKWLGFTPETVLQQVREAETDHAPVDSIQKIDGKWLRLDDIESKSNRQAVDALARG